MGRKPAASAAVAAAGKSSGGAVRREEPDVYPGIDVSSTRSAEHRSRNRDDAARVAQIPLPRSLDVLEFAKAREDELHFLTTNMGDPSKGTQRVFQTLPRHLRRRTMSHNIYRLPARLRQAARTEMAKMEERPRLPISRRSRRRPHVMLEEYVRRQRQHKWLETHIWHAKRMFMVNFWGYRLAERPTDKALKANVKATQHFCTVHDASYNRCIQLDGAQSAILALLQRILPPRSSIAQKQYLSGGREGSAMLHKPDSFPLGAICPVSFLWRPSIDSSGDGVDPAARSLWLWLHPAVYDEVLTLLQQLTDAASAPSDARITVASASEQSTRAPPSSPAADPMAGTVTDSVPMDLSRSANVSATPSVTVRALQPDLLRFEVYGSRANAVLGTVLRPHPTASSDNAQAWSFFSSLRSAASVPQRAVLALTVDDPSTFTPKQPWSNAPSAPKPRAGTEAKSHVSDAPVSPPPSTAAPKTLHGAAATVFAPSVLSSHPAAFSSAASANAPQTTTPRVSKRAAASATDGAAHPLSAAPSPRMMELLLHWSPSLARSGLWDDTWRAELTGRAPFVKRPRFNNPVAENQRRSVARNAGAPNVPPLIAIPDGDRASDFKGDARTPITSHALGSPASAGVDILLIQRPAALRGGFASGWDLIVPAGWGRVFWKSLIYAGGRALGLSDRRRVYAEAGVPCFPNDYPDTVAGAMLAMHSASDQQFVYVRKPPAKRPNYAKLGCVHPFAPSWECVLPLSAPQCTARFAVAESSGNSVDARAHSTEQATEKPDKLNRTVQRSATDGPVPMQVDGTPSGDYTESKVSPVNACVFDVKHAAPGFSTDHKATASASAVQTQLLGFNPYISRKAAKSGRPLPTSAVQVFTQPRFSVARSVSQLREWIASRSSGAALASASAHDRGDAVLATLLAVHRLGVAGLVRVTVHASRGVPAPQSMICVPTEQDRVDFAATGKHWQGPVERQPFPQSRPRIHAASCDDPCLMKQCVRRCIGFVTYGAQSLLRGSGYGLGFVAIDALPALFQVNDVSSALVRPEDVNSQDPSAENSATAAAGVASEADVKMVSTSVKRGPTSHLTRPSKMRRGEDCVVDESASVGHVSQHVQRGASLPEAFALMRNPASIQYRACTIRVALA